MGKDAQNRGQKPECRAAFAFGPHANEVHENWYSRTVTVTLSIVMER
jgi:hypothetical protein